MIGVIINRGNLEAALYTGRTCEGWTYVTISHGPIRREERGLEHILLWCLQREPDPADTFISDF